MTIVQKLWMIVFIFAWHFLVGLGSSYALYLPKSSKFFLAGLILSGVLLNWVGSYPPLGAMVMAAAIGMFALQVADRYARKLLNANAIVVRSIDRSTSIAKS